jgi:hypothetical protein
MTQLEWDLFMAHPVSSETTCPICQQSMPNIDWRDYIRVNGYIYGADLPRGITAGAFNTEEKSRVWEIPDSGQYADQVIRTFVPMHARCVKLLNKSYQVAKQAECTHQRMQIWHQRCPECYKANTQKEPDGQSKTHA